jgi:membrane protein DedA with SNARE-associated domain
MTAGVLRINRKKFISTCLLITIPRALFFTIVGYYLGVLINPVLKYYNLTGYLIIVIIIVAIVSYVIYKKLFERLELTYKVKKAFFLLL